MQNIEKLPLDPLKSLPVGSFDPLSDRDKINNDRSNIFDLQRRIRALETLISPPLLTVNGSAPSGIPEKFSDSFWIYDTGSEYRFYVYASGMGWRYTVLI